MLPFATKDMVTVATISAPLAGLQGLGASELTIWLLHENRGASRGRPRAVVVTQPTSM